MTQRIIVSRDFLSDLPHVLETAHTKRLLLVCDTAFQYLPIRNEFDDLPVVRFSDFTPNPRYEDVRQGVLLFNAQKCDGIVAVGGGSAMDVAKCVKLFSRMNASENFLKQPFLDTGVPLIAIPTTAGTGSESTRFAVIYFEGKKQSIAHRSIIPDCALLVPEVLKTLPLYQKKCTILDALCQGIESWWSVKSTAESRALAHRAVSTIVCNMDAYLTDNTDAAAESVMTAANLAGQAINITQTTAAHAMSYKLTSLYHLPHGHAVALCFPEVWGYMLAHMEYCIDPRGEAYLNKVFGEIAQSMGCENAKSAVAWFFNLMNRLEMKKPSSCNKENDIVTLTACVNPTRLANSPVALEQSAFHTMYEGIVEIEG